MEGGEHLEGYPLELLLVIANQGHTGSIMDAARAAGAEFVLTYIHWGVEYDAYPQDYQTKIATDCFNAGADLILGAHTHCLQGISYISGKPVFYSLGNFVFGQNIDKTAAVKVQVSSDGTVSYGLLPVYAGGGTTN